MGGGWGGATLCSTVPHVGPAGAADCRRRCTLDPAQRPSERLQRPAFAPCRELDTPVGCRSVGSMLMGGVDCVEAVSSVTYVLFYDQYSAIGTRAGRFKKGDHFLSSRRLLSIGAPAPARHP